MLELKDPDGTQHYTGVCLMQTDRTPSDQNLKNCALLDSESTVHDFCNENLL